jgi:hypothetical protein
MNIEPPSRKYKSLQVTKARNNNSPKDGLQNTKNTAGLYIGGTTNIGNEFRGLGDMYATGKVSGSGLFLRNVSNWEYFDLDNRTDIFRETSNVSIGVRDTVYKLDVNGVMSITGDLVSAGYQHPSLIQFHKNDSIYLRVDGNESSVSFNTDTPESTSFLTVNNTVITHNLLVNNRLIINGTTTNINTQNIKIHDPIITINSNQTGIPTKDTGFIVDRSVSNLNAGIIWDETNDNFMFIYTNSSGSNLTEDTVPVDSYGNLHLRTLNADGNVSAVNFIGNGTKIGEVHQDISKQYTITDNGVGLEVDGSFRPVLTLLRGVKYLFFIDTTETFFFSPNDTSNITDIYNDGIVLGSNRLIFDVPFNAPNSMYYQSGDTINFGNKVNFVDSKLISNDCRNYIEVEKEIDNNMINFFTNN